MTFQTTATTTTSTKTAANAAVLFFTGLCVIGQATAFTSTNSVPSLSSSFHFSNKRSAPASAAASIVQRNMVYNYDGEDEKVGPFHCSGELEVDEHSARRLEHFFHSDDKPATAMPTTATFSSSSSLAGIDTSSGASFENDTTDIDRILLEMGIDFDAEQDPNMPFHYSRESTMDERIERMREVLQIDFEAEQDNGRELASQEQQNGNDASTYSWQ